jgi:acrylyl-CoA reductase (NADPH)/3-hydroxypropionyl-CoA dehydratase/3-hydroxypropionyl-CoA synthetase
MTQIQAANIIRPMHSASEESERRTAASSDPGAFHGTIAAAELHWFDPEKARWIRLDPDAGRWSGYAAADGAPADASDRSGGWRPWTKAFDDSAAPFYRWFSGGLTNASYNELDRHVLAGKGDRPAFLFEGDRWDPSKNDGRGGPVHEEVITYRRLLLETVIRAEVLSSLGLKKGDRIAFNLPNIPEQLFYTEAAKRLGIIYTPVFGGFSAKTLSDRIADAGAKVVVTADGGYRNAEVVPYKEAFTDLALDTYIPLPAGLKAMDDVVDASAPAEVAARLREAVRDGLKGEITVERSDVMRELGRALDGETTLSAPEKAALRTSVARSLAEASHTVEKVIVVRHTGQEIVEQARDLPSRDLVAAAEKKVLDAAKAAGAKVTSREELLALGDAELYRALAGVHPAVPVDSDYPLFIIYTSGSTGKPKGVVHTHGGWLAGIAHSMRAVFGVTDEDRIYVIADPGWITGQSYLIAAPLACGITSVVVEGSPLFPHAGRFSSVIERHGATIFKAGSTFLKAVMTDPESTSDMKAFDMARLKAATFCAEPVSPAVQEFAMKEVCPHYVNSYWATEHGGIVFSCPWGDFKDLQADAKTWPLPWIDAEVRVAEERDERGRATKWRPAEEGEKGELVITRPYPYLARTIWGDPERLGTPEWRGDLERFTQVYFDKWSGGYTYTQGDYARRHADGAFTLHGRSDDVINVSGHRIGTEEIEGAILRDKILKQDSPVGNAVVVGAPHDEKGETPVAFLIPAPGKKLTGDDIDRLKKLVRTEKGATAVPSDFLVVSQFPETRSGKYMRRTLRGILLDLPLGDISTLRNPESVEEVREVVNAWREHGRLAEARQIVQTHRYLRVENHEIAPGKVVAVVVMNNPPVNALSERALDDLGTVAQHLGTREDTVAVVITGAGTAFVAGADVKELLEIGEAGDRESAITPPNAAHQAFAVLEKLGKPVIAAVNGPALGGGNELVLACTYVIAQAKARFGQPEINLNLLPGYGGTQRLPRRLFARRGREGLEDAVQMIVGGRALEADEAVSAGLVDEVVGRPGDPRGALEAAIEAVRRYVGGDGPLVEAERRHAAELAQAEEKIPYPSDLEAAPGVKDVLRQARTSGRDEPVARCLEALRVGLEEGRPAGVKREAQLFAEAVCDPESGPTGIRAFLERRSAPLPVKQVPVPPTADAALRAKLEEAGDLLPLDAAFYPGITKLPKYMYAMGVVKRDEDGAPDHGDPKDCERLVVVPTPEPGPNDALVYVLASEVNFNDIWAVTGIPVSPFEPRDTDVVYTGSGGVGIVVQLGAECQREGRVAVGDLVTIYSGQSELLSPDQGLDPMVADFRIQGYERFDGTHAQFTAVQGPQLHKKLGDLTFEQAGAYGLNLGTISRALFTTLEIKPGQRLFVEGASTGTGLETLRSSVASGLAVAGLVSSEERAERVRTFGGEGVNRKDPRWADAFTPVPDDPSQVDAWVKAGEAFVKEVHAKAGGPIDCAVSHAGERAFPRTFQTLGEGGVLTFYGASSGYRFTFVGKKGTADIQEMLIRGGAQAGKAILIHYGAGAEDGIVDRVGIEAIEAACNLRGRVAVLADTIAQKEFIYSLGFGEAFSGAVSIEEIARRLGEDFDRPGSLPPMPDAFKDTGTFKEAVRKFADRTLKPVGSAIAPLLRTQGDKRGLPDVIFERAGRDTLPLSTSLVKPNIGRIVYAENLEGVRLTFYAPQVWMRQRRILMPSAEIRGTHLNTAYEFAEMQKRVASGLIDVVDPTPVPMEALAEAHQAMWENRHAGATYVATHALPRHGLKTKDELYRAWALRDAEKRGVAFTRVDTGSAGALR